MDFALTPRPSAAEEQPKAETGIDWNLDEDGEQGRLCAWNELEIEVLRLGGLNKACEVRYVLDLDENDPLRHTAEKMFRFADESCSLKFQDNETTKIFTILLEPNDDFDSVVEIPLKLEAICDSCEICPHFGRTRVKVIDNDVFPSTRFIDKITKDPTCEEWKTGNDVRMVLEIIWYCYKCNRWGANMMLAGDLISNLIFIGQLKLFETLINALADTDNGLHTRAGVLWLAFGITAPYAFTHAFNFNKQKWKVGGKARKELLKELLVRILYSKDMQKQQVKETEVKETFSHHVFMVVSNIYMQSFAIFAAFTRFVFIMLYFWYTAFYVMTGSADNNPVFFEFIPFFFAVPLVAYIFTTLRQNKNRQVREKAEHARMELSDFLRAVIDNYRMVADCGARPQVIANSFQLIEEVNTSLVKEGKGQANDVAFFGWARKLVDGSVIIIGGFLVVSKKPSIMSLGAFLATFKGLSQATAQYGLIFSAALKMQGSLPAMWLLCRYMNMPLDLDKRLDMQCSHLELLEEVQMECRDRPESAGGALAELDLPIKVDMKRGFDFESTHPLQLSVQLPGSDEGCPNSPCGNGERGVQAVLENVRLTVEQGTVIGITGQAGGGKKTLLRVLAQVLPLSDGAVFIPSHLRILNVEIQKNLYSALIRNPDKTFDSAVAYNVYFALIATKGVNRISELTPQERENGVKVCEALKMDEKILQVVREYKVKEREYNKDSAERDLRTLSGSAKIKIQLARALIADPEILVLHQPTEGLNEADTTTVTQLLLDFVKKNQESEYRRRRTCIFTSNRPNVLALADQVYSVEQGLCRPLPRLEIESQTLHAQPEHAKVQLLMAENEDLRARLARAEDEVKKLRQGAVVVETKGEVDDG